MARPTPRAKLQKAPTRRRPTTTRAGREPTGDVARRPDAREEPTGDVARRPDAREEPTGDVASLAGARHAALPAFIEPQKATLVSEAPRGDDWLHELKFDGYRILARVAPQGIQLLTRNAKDWTRQMPALAGEVEKLGFDSALMDGEIAVLDERGISNFQQLQNALGAGAEANIVYFVFDLPFFGGCDLRGVPLEERKSALRTLLVRARKNGRIRYSDHVVGSGPEFFARACEKKLEGIVSKRRNAPYTSGRTKSWLKVKCLGRQEFVIVGFTDPEGSREHFGALLLGLKKGDGLVYAGKVGTGFTRRSLAELSSNLLPLEQPTSSVADPPRGADARGVHWVRPELVAEVEFTELTGDGRVRHPSFRGLRTDKAAEEVVIERPHDLRRKRGR